MIHPMYTGVFYLAIYATKILFLSAVSRQSSSSSSKMAVLGTPSSLITPRYIPEQFSGIATAYMHINMRRDAYQHTPITTNEHAPFPAASNATTPPTPPSLRNSSTHAAAAAPRDSCRKRMRRAIVDAVARRMKYWTV